MTLMNSDEEKIYGRSVMEVEYYDPRTQITESVELVLYSTDEDALNKVVFWGYRRFNGRKHVYHMFREVTTAGQMLDKFLEEMGLSNSYTTARRVTKTL